MAACYIPEDLPIKSLDFERLFRLVADANDSLARFDGLLQNLIEPDLLLAPMMSEESVLSSRIEGTQATLDDVLQFDAGIQQPSEKMGDVREVINYRSAMQFGNEQLVSRPLSLGFLRELHQILMRDVRGDEKTPGQFRTQQNFIGRPGSTINTATFVPPVPMRVQSDMEAWERYVQGDDVETLLQSAVMHAQFELIHPFNDGNGRIGRLLIPLFLFQKRKLSRPSFYISAYLEKHRNTYYRSLRNVSEHRDWNSWIAFFLSAITVQSQENSKTVKAILELYRNMEHVIREATRSQYSSHIRDAMFRQPLFQSSDFSEKTGLTKNTANSLLGQLKKAGIIHEVSPARGRKPGILAFSRLLSILHDNQ